MTPGEATMVRLAADAASRISSMAHLMAQAFDKPGETHIMEAIEGLEGLAEDLSSDLIRIAQAGEA